VVQVASSTPTTSPLTSPPTGRDPPRGPFRFSSRSHHHHPRAPRPRPAPRTTNQPPPQQPGQYEPRIEVSGLVLSPPFSALLASAPLSLPLPLSPTPPPRPAKGATSAPRAAALPSASLCCPASGTQPHTFSMLSLFPGGPVLAARSDTIRPHHPHSATPSRNRRRARLHSAEQLPFFTGQAFMSGKRAAIRSTLLPSFRAALHSPRAAT